MSILNMALLFKILTVTHVDLGTYFHSGMYVDPVGHLQYHHVPHIGGCAKRLQLTLSEPSWLASHQVLPKSDREGEAGVQCEAFPKSPCCQCLRL